jgi:hypothetical protein
VISRTAIRARGAQSQVVRLASREVERIDAPLLRGHARSAAHVAPSIEAETR